MKKIFSTMIVTALLFTMMSMTVFASYVPSQEDQYLPEATTEANGDGESTTAALPDDEFYEEENKKDGTAKTTADKSKAPKTGDERVMIYTVVMAMIAATGTMIIAKRKED